MTLRLALIVAFAVMTAGGFAAASGAPPSVPAVDAPELAALGPYAVGVESLTLVQAAQADVLAPVAAGGALPIRDRELPIDVWYPAKAGGAPTVYSGALTGEDGKDVAFTIPALAVRGAAPAPGSFPLVILAHGYGGTPVAMSWVAENLASKGYVVVGPHFRDPPYGDAAGLAQPLARRPLDIAFVAAQAQGRARANQGVFAAADPTRTVLIGYSMGGYGVLTAAGGALSPTLGPITHGALAPYVAGAPRAGALKVKDVAAVVAISPAGMFGAAEAWGPTGLAGVTAPTLFLVGGRDPLVGYDPGVKTLWTQEIHAPRYLLTFENGGHSIGMDPAPETMRARLWDLDWWEDPVWRKARVIGIQLHMITAFLDRYVAHDAAGAADLDVATPLSSDGVWAAKAGEPYAAVSPGGPANTVWKGFQRAHAQGLELRFAPPR
jgi:predicted dienelactone hydrolase